MNIDSINNLLSFKGVCTYVDDMEKKSRIAVLNHIAGYSFLFNECLRF